MDETISEKRPNGFWEFARAVIISIVIVIPVRMYIAQPFIVDGASMEPNFAGGDYLIIDELTYQFREPRRGDVIVFRYPLNRSQFFIKRIVGLPEETVEIIDSMVNILRSDGSVTKIYEPYLADNTKTIPNLQMKLGKEEYFVLGDNRTHSSDSRVWGVLPKGNITGRAFVRLFPPSSIDYLLNNKTLFFVTQMAQ